MRTFLRAAIVAVSFAGNAVPSYAFIDDAKGHNTISEQDEEKVLELWTRVLNFSKGLSQTMLGIRRSETLPTPETYRTLFCVMQIDMDATVMERDLYGAVVAIQISSELQYSIDEKLTLGTVKVALEQTANFATFARGDLNRILAGCARQRRLAYDKATSLLLLVQESENFTIPLRRRIELSRLHDELANPATEQNK